MKRRFRSSGLAVFGLLMTAAFASACGSSADSVHDAGIEIADGGAADARRVSSLTSLMPVRLS